MTNMNPSNRDFGLRTPYDGWGSEDRTAWFMLPDDKCHEFRVTGIDLYTHLKEGDSPNNQDGPWIYSQECQELSTTRREDLEVARNT